MANLENEFKTFLSEIEPSQEAKSYAQEAHEPIRKHLEQDSSFKEYFDSSFLYGSYKRSTAVGDIKDVDIIVLTKFDPKTHTPEVALSILKTAIETHYGESNQDYQTRSIRVNDPLPGKDTEMTLDIVPAIAIEGEDEALLVPDRDLQTWKPSNPKGHLRNTTELNSEENSKGKYVPLVKIVKWWWKYQASIKQPDNDKPRPKGFWLECLTGENYQYTGTYSGDFVSLLRSINSTYSPDSGVPALPDPGLPEEVIGTGMSQEEFNLFLETVEESLQKAEIALANPDVNESSILWQEILGEKFPISAETEQETLIALDDISHKQRPAWPARISYTLRITKCVAYKHSVMDLRSDSYPILDGYDLTYLAETNATEPYEVFWQVTNTGQHARDVGGLRGGFESPKDPRYPLRQTEVSQYTGKHMIQCFLVKDGYLIAMSDPFYLNVVHKNRGRFWKKK